MNTDLLEHATLCVFAGQLFRTFFDNWKEERTHYDELHYQLLGDWFNDEEAPMGRVEIVGYCDVIFDDYKVDTALFLPTGHTKKVLESIEKSWKAAGMSCSLEELAELDEAYFNALVSEVLGAYGAGVGFYDSISYDKDLEELGVPKSLPNYPYFCEDDDAPWKCAIALLGTDIGRIRFDDWFAEKVSDLRDEQEDYPELAVLDAILKVNNDLMGTSMSEYILRQFSDWFE